MGEGGDTGFHLRLTETAYAGWKAAADGEGMTTAGLLEMVGRQLAATGTIDLRSGLEAASGRLAPQQA